MTPAKRKAKPRPEPRPRHIHIQVEAAPCDSHRCPECRQRQAEADERVPVHPELRAHPAMLERITNEWLDRGLIA